MLLPLWLSMVIGYQWLLMAINAQVTLITGFEVSSVGKVSGVIKRKMTVFPETVFTYSFLHYAGRKKGHHRVRFVKAH